ncbi:hypothetical protein TrST_g5329 [Triparma strigata]|uniref:Uncharacterized protein n=1 Tax=Triparma strigata TaxID=1606541 RepID=A0A9W7ESU6_9STRA|nr:hypothetical protein TrST_g5329 [Triparma strigata]
MAAKAGQSTLNAWKGVGIFLLLYYAASEHVLLQEYGPQVGAYQGLWICSVSILLSGFGMLFNRPTACGAGLVAVSTGHFLWTIDTFFMVYNGSMDPMKVPFGIADYNSSTGEAEWATIITTSHHLWYMPMCCLYFRSIGVKLEIKHLYWSILWILVVSAGTAMVVPLGCINHTLRDGREVCMNLNVNMVKKWWGLEDIWFFHALDRENGTHAVIFYLYANFLHNYCLNGIWYNVLKIFANGWGSEDTTTKNTKKTKKKKA